MRHRCGAKIAKDLSLFLGAVLSFGFVGHVSATDMGLSINVSNTDSLSIVLGGEGSDGSVAVDITPHDTAGTFNESGDVTATVITTNRNGYTLSMTRSSAGMSSDDTNNTATIDELSSSEDGYTSATFPANKWGYSLKTDEVFGNYFGIGDGVELQNSSETTNGTTSTLKFGAKANIDMPAGSYSTTINFIATAKPASVLYMQDITSLNCPTNPTTVIDSRDGEEYTIQKLIDDNCWMLDNLRLGGDTTVMLTADSSNVVNSFTLPVNTPVSDEGTPYTYVEPQINSESKNETIEYIYGSGSGKIGVYYNYCAASAGSICTTDGFYDMAPQDVCPKGWQMPTLQLGDGNHLDDLWGLYEAYGRNTENFHSSLRLVRSGDFVYGHYDGQGSGGLLWSINGNTPGGYAEYAAALTAGVNYPGHAASVRSYGLSVRCVTKEPAMQDVSTWKNSLGINDSIRVIDKRDGKRYWATKLETDPNIPDGRADCTGVGDDRVCTQIWMTENLDLDLTAGTKTYTHNDTDLGWSDGDINAVWTPQANAGGAFTDEYDIERWYNSGTYFYFTSNQDSDDEEYGYISVCIENGHSLSDCEHYFAGNLYNYYAAAALGATSGGSPIVVDTSQYSEVSNSICPAGWRLPTGLTAADGYSDFDHLLYRNSVTTGHGGQTVNVGYTTHIYGDTEAETIGFNNLRAQPVWFVRAGSVNGDGLAHQASYGRYWSSTIYDSERAYALYHYSGGIYPANNNDRQNGFSIRCVAR